MKRIAASAAILFLTASGVSHAQTIYTVPDPANGVLNSSFAPGSGNVANVAITSAQPRSGNGSLELQMTNFAQPGVFLGGTGFTGSLAQLSALSFDFLGTNPVNTTPTIRVVFQANFNNALRTFNLGWYRNSGAPNWENSGNLTTVASSPDGSTGFWLRLTGAGGNQLARDCGTGGLASSFDDRRQSFADWMSACTGVAGTFDFTGANVIGVQVDQGRWPGFVGTNTNYVDNVSVQFGSSPSTTANFEVVPEPSTYALMGAGLLGLFAVQRRRRQA